LVPTLLGDYRPSRLERGKDRLTPWGERREESVSFCYGGEGIVLLLQRGGGLPGKRHGGEKISTTTTEGKGGPYSASKKNDIQILQRKGEKNQARTSPKGKNKGGGQGSVMSTEKRGEKVSQREHQGKREDNNQSHRRAKEVGMVVSNRNEGKRGKERKTVFIAKGEGLSPSKGFSYRRRKIRELPHLIRNTEREEKKEGVLCVSRKKDSIKHHDRKKKRH